MDFTLEYGPLFTDQPSYRNPGLVTAKNVRPRRNSYGPFRGLTVVSNALTERCLGAVSARDANDDVFVYAGDENRLYEMVNSTFTEESQSAGGYTTGLNDVWEFAVWNAKSKILATNYTDAVQSIDIGGGSVGAFADTITSTNKPKSKHIAIVGRFVVLGWTNDSTDGEKPSRIWWSGIDDETDFDPDSATQCDYEDLATGGVVQRVIGGTEYGLIFQNRMVRTMRYVGGGTVFDLLPLNYVPGTPIPNSVIAYNGMVFWIAEDGFMGMSGVQSQPIGNDKIDRKFQAEFDITDRRYVSSAIDPVNKIVAWAYPGTGATSNLPNKILMCKYDEAKWAEAEIDTTVLLNTETQGYTLDGLDVLGTDIDDSAVFDESLDSEKWRGRSIRFGAFNHSNTLGHFTGATLAATLDTGDIQPKDGMTWQVSGVRPLVDGGDASVSIASKQKLQDSVSYGPAVIMNYDGICPMRSPDARYHRIRVSLSASTSWSHIQGLQLDFTLNGKR